MGILESLEASGFATWVRESPSLLAYQLFITLHTIGLALLVGISAGISFRILGVAADLPLARMEKYYRVMWLGLLINGFSGVVLFVTEPVKFATLPAFYIKMSAVVVGVVVMQKILTQVLRDPAVLRGSVAPAKGKTLAAIALGSWGVAILAGRVTAYSTSVQLQTAAAVVLTAIVLAIVGTMVTRRGRVVDAGSAAATTGARRSDA